MSEERRAGLASQRVPGVIWQLQITDDLPERPLRGLRDEWWKFEADGERLDQIGWPVRFDAELARRACVAAPRLNEASRRIVDEYLIDPARPIFDRDVPQVIAMFAGETTVEQRALLIATLFSRRTPAEQAMLARIDAGPVEASVRHALTAHLAVEDGWLAYYVHRGLATIATTAAADALRLLLRDGQTSPETIYAWADELLATLT